MAKYPIFLELGGRRVVVIGAGAVAIRKAQSLLDPGARLVVVSEHIDSAMTTLCQQANAELVRSKYSKDHLVGAALVIAATSNRQLNERIYKDCQELEILCNVVDQPQLADFFVPAVVKRSHLQIAITTEGDCPAYAGHLRKKLEQIFTVQHGEFLAQLKTLRKLIIETVPNPADRNALLGQLVEDQSFEYFIQNGPAAWRDRAEKITKQHKTHV